MHFENASLRFECTACGRCCTGSKNYHVYLSAQEAGRIRRYLDLSASWFRRRYLTRLPTGDLVTTLKDNGECIFLGLDNRCRVYGARPQQCRSYPFWPELVTSSRAWHGEAKRCEGIGRGKVISTAHIRALIDKG